VFGSSELEPVPGFRVATVTPTTGVGTSFDLIASNGFDFDTPAAAVALNANRIHIYSRVRTDRSFAVNSWF